MGAGADSTIIEGNGIDRVLNMAVTAPVRISELTVTGGSTPDSGGGILNQGSSLEIARVTIRGNTTTDLNSGGGVFQTSGTLTISDSTISGNTSTFYGGGLAAIDSLVTMTNVTVSGNTASVYGGGILSIGPSAAIDLVNASVTANTVNSDAMGPGGGGGVYRDDGTVTLRDTIVGGNIDLSAGPGRPDCLGAVVSGGHNLIGDDTGCTIAPAAGDRIGTGAAPIDPGLGPLADNGGPTRTHALLTGSPAIDAGGADCAATDQRGLPRTRACDIGAYERVLCGKVPVNRIGTPGRDRLSGTPGPDGLLGQGGGDTLLAKGGKDGLCGGPRKDTLKGGGGKDRLDGGPGKDTCVGQGGKDRAKGCEVKKSL